MVQVPVKGSSEGWGFFEEVPPDQRCEGTRGRGGTAGEYLLKVYPGEERLVQRLWGRSMAAC